MLHYCHYCTERTHILLCCLKRDLPAHMSALATPVVIMTTFSSAANHDKSGIMTTHGFQCDTDRMFCWPILSRFHSLMFCTLQEYTIGTWNKGKQVLYNDQADEPMKLTTTNMYTARARFESQLAGGRVGWMIIGTGCQVQVFSAWFLIAQSVCQRAFSLLAIWCLRP